MQELRSLRRRHLVLGWWSLLVFLSLGIVLEGLHGFKLRWYLDVASETRRLMFTLAHAHGTLLALVHLAFADVVGRAGLAPDGADGVRIPLALGEGTSRALVAAGLLLPAGFLLGGLFVYDGDPGLGVLLVPAGAVLLLFAVFRTARAVSRRG